MNPYHPNRRWLRIVVAILCIINFCILVLLMLDASPISLSKSTSVAQRVSGRGTDASSLIGSTGSSGSSTAAAASDSDTEEETRNALLIRLDDKRLPVVSQDDLDDLVQIYSRAGVLSAEDTDGNDITDDIRESYRPDAQNLGTFVVTFSVEASDGTTDSRDVYVTVDIERPILILSTDQATMKRGDTFNYWNYLVAAEDIDGSPLNDAIMVQGRDFDTSESGTYEVVYRIRSKIDGTLSEETLTITVE